MKRLNHYYCTYCYCGPLADKSLKCCKDEQSKLSLSCVRLVELYCMFVYD